MTTNSKTGAELFARTLEQYGVQHVFGNPGTSEVAIVDAISDYDIEYVLALHEDIAVGMAAGYASVRRYHAHDDPGINPAPVVNLHLAAGLGHGIGNLHGAKFSGTPMVLTAGNHATDQQYQEPVLSGNLVEMTDQFTKWSAEVKSVDALPEMLRRAFRIALTPPTGPVFLALPMDVMLAETTKDPRRLGSIPDGGAGTAEAIDVAAAALLEADDPVLVAGDQIAQSGPDSIDAAVALAERLGARVHGQIMGSEINFPTGHDQWVAFISPGQDIADEILDTDTILFVGDSQNPTSTLYYDRLGRDDATRIQVSDDPSHIGKNQISDVSIIGDPGQVLWQLYERLAGEVSDEDRERRLDKIREFQKRDDLAGWSERDTDGSGDNETANVTKEGLVDAIAACAPDAFVFDESITSKFVMLSGRSFAPRQWISNKGGGLGYGLPAAVGAAIAERHTESPRDVIGFVGDGSYLYYPHTMYTAARYDVDLVVAIPDNRSYHILKDNTLNILGGEHGDYDYLGMDFEPPVDFALNAKSHGASPHVVESDDELVPAFEAALAESGPSVIDAVIGREA